MPASELPEPELSPRPPFDEPQPLAPEPPVKRRSAARWLIIALVTTFLSCGGCCGFTVLRSCTTGVAGEQAGRAVAERYLAVVSAHDWRGVYDLSAPALQAAQSLDTQQALFESHPELFDFDNASFDGVNYFSNALGGDTLRLSGALHGRSTMGRRFQMVLVEQPGGSWRVNSFNVTMQLANTPLAPVDSGAASVDAGPPWTSQ